MVENNNYEVKEIGLESRLSKLILGLGGMFLFGREIGSEIVYLSMLSENFPNFDELYRNYEINFVKFAVFLFNF